MHRLAASTMRVALLTSHMLLAGCGWGDVEVSHPFYILPVPDFSERALYRCPYGPGEGCAIDGLPGPDVFAGGASNSYIVVARHSRGRTEYFYFARIPEETAGWGNNPEQVVGPLNQQAFDEAKSRLGLPDFTVKAP